jgi:hypothetical protein
MILLPKPRRSTPRIDSSSVRSLLADISHVGLRGCSYRDKDNTFLRATCRNVYLGRTFIARDAGLRIMVRRKP